MFLNNGQSWLHISKWTWCIKHEKQTNAADIRLRARHVTAFFEVTTFDPSAKRWQMKVTWLWTGVVVWTRRTWIDVTLILEHSGIIDPAGRVHIFLPESSHQIGARRTDPALFIGCAIIDFLRWLLVIHHKRRPVDEFFFPILGPSSRFRAVQFQPSHPHSWRSAHFTEYATCPPQDKDNFPKFHFRTRTVRNSQK